MAKTYFQKAYKFDDKKEAFVIEVSLDDYNDVYDDWDPSPFKKRDIEDEFNEFIVNSSEDIPFKYSIMLNLYIPEGKKNTDKETALVAAYKNFYSYALSRLNKSKSNLNRKNFLYLVLSVFFLTGGFFFREVNLFFKILQEGIFIGGWVFLWEFFTNVFISKRELQKEYKLYKRLYHSDIRFIYY
ncbi:hypothetical protein EDC18_10390 [Natranaerovirga pectinivora]|uniref:Uncharacterized protein n=1 Tax=Natranaerovirga pectinivora TaxID=682400 RepID=A0A4R3MMA8_9FIRM|nr:hypothetical protein [Natranaerovirga pectinivora]TCT15385.1 hypothetical protein EDC18_10390 [Natranaerovirga pectinivora]